jgi:hypothetical protein
MAGKHLIGAVAADHLERQIIGHRFRPMRSMVERVL